MTWLEYTGIVKEQRMKQEKETNQLKETMRLENEEHERRWGRKQKQYEFEINQLEERAKLESTEMEKLRKDNEQLRGLREEERLKWEGKWSQEVEQHNNMGCVTSQGRMLVVRDLIDITRQMTPQLEQTLIKETQGEMQELKEITEKLTVKETQTKMETVEIITGAQESETCWARLMKVTERVTVTEREKLNGVTGTCRARHEEMMERTTKTTEIKTETREIEGELIVVKDEHTQVEIVEDNGGELAECVVTRCEQQDSLLQERGEGICPLEADRDQVGSVAPCELEGESAVNGYTRSLGGMETLGALVVARIPSTIVPVCVW